MQKLNYYCKACITFSFLFVNDLMFLFEKFFSVFKSGFAVNLLEDKDDSENITFQFNPRGPKSKVVMNTRHHGNWGKETVLKDKDVVNDYFQNTFELRIHVKDIKKILVYVNGQLKTEFSCKTDITRVNYVCYSSNLSIE